MIRSATAEDVGHAVADQHHRDALVAQMLDVVQHLGDLPHRDRRGRLVHQHQLGVGEHGARDRHRLPLAAGHLPDQIARPRLGLQVPEELAGAPVHAAIVEDRHRPELAPHLAAEKHVGRRGQVVAERQILVDDLDAVPPRLDRPVQHDLATVHPHRAVAREEVAGDHLDQRRLAGAVVAHQPDDLAGLDRQRDVVHRLDGAEMLRDVDELENGQRSSEPPIARHAPHCPGF